MYSLVAPFREKNGRKQIASVILAAAFLLVGSWFVSTAHAGVGVGVSPNFPPTVTVGDNNVPVTLAITNNSDGTDGNPLTLTSIKLIPSCGAISGVSCATPDLGVFSVDPAGTGAGSCAANTFTIAQTNATTGEVTFTPDASIALTPGQTCTINFTVDVVGTPDTDATGAAGLQTLQLGNVTGTDQNSQPGSGFGSDATTVNKVSPQISTTQSSGGVVGIVLNDTATLTGGLTPTGNVTFKLFAPADATCQGTAVYTQVDVSSPYATSPGFTSTAVGTYHWTADYAGDANNNATSSGCQAEPVTTTKASPGIQTTQSAGGLVGTVLNDTATLSGGASPTGNVTFKLFPPTDAACEGTAVYTDTDATSPYATSPGYTSLVAGTYRWTAAYAGDANNNAVTSGCADEPVVVTAPKGRIIVDKVTVPAADTQSFSFVAGGTGYSNFSLTDAAAPNNQELNAGSYSVSETLPSGWTQTSATCVSSIQDTETPGTLELDAGETITCTFTNTKKGHIIVDKITVPAGSSQSFSFTGGGTGYTNFSLTDAATPNNQEVVPGAYTVAEGVVAGWSSNGGVCDNGETPASLDVGAGETVTCTFTNTLQTGHLLVQKTTLPAGDTTVFTINASGSGTITGGGAGTVTDAADRAYEVTAGTYSVAETVPTGWDKTGDTCQNVVVTAGATSTCMLTNTKRGHLIVDKVTNPAGDTTSFSILASGTGVITGGATGSVTDATNKDYEVAPGTYSVAETVPTGWTQSSSTCNGVVVGPGETKTCQVVNTKAAVQGCSPGYWKQPQHFGSYPTPTAYPNTLFSAIFGSNVFGTSTLLDVLSTGGGGQIALGRIMVGAYLNASTVVGFPYTPAQVIAAFTGATPATYDSVKATFEALQDPCPFGNNPGPAGPGLPLADKPGKSGKNR